MGSPIFMLHIAWDQTPLLTPSSSKGSKKKKKVGNLLKSLAAQMVMNPPQCRRPGFGPWVRKIPLRKRLPIPCQVFLPGESHGQRSLAGYSPWGHKELAMTE